MILNCNPYATDFMIKKWQNGIDVCCEQLMSNSYYSIFYLRKIVDTQLIGDISSKKNKIISKYIYISPRKNIFNDNNLIDHTIFITIFR